MRTRAILLLLFGLAWQVRAADKAPPAVTEGANHKLVYAPGARGDRVPDYSFAGYRAGQAAIPDVPVRVYVKPSPGDNTAIIQRAIDYVASLPPDQRGAVLLAPGRYEIVSGLTIGASGVVLRGSGAGENGTILQATGHDRRTLITIAGKNDRAFTSTPLPVADSYVPVNSLRLRLADIGSLKVGDNIIVRRPSSAEWIKALNMSDVGGGIGLGWKPGSRDILWDRTISHIDANQITIDGPFTTALDATLGGGTVAAYSWPGRITNAGVENLRCESDFDPANPKDESHSWFAVTIDDAADAWVRQVTAAHFAGGAIAIFESCRRVTVEDCKSLAPVSEIAGFRRHSFFTNGSQTLFQRCYSENGRHDFSVGHCAAGPNAFVQCQAINALDDSGPIDSWASGVLLDNVRIDGNALSLMNRWQAAQFAGWSAANCMLWNCSAALINCYNPPGARNWAIGCWGQFAGDGDFQSSNNFANPDSLYYAQLGERLGTDVSARADFMTAGSDGYTNPTLEQAAQQTDIAKKPAPSLSHWIDSAAKRHPIPIDSAGAKSIDDIAPPGQAAPVSSKPIEIRNGVIVCDGKPISGSRIEGAWWRGGIRPADIPGNIKMPCAVRFVPGRVGAGLTDDLNALTDAMIANVQISFVHHYALWYDRRDDDHERTRRMNGDAWPPFYELPFARSGKELAWDGLSKYDLTRYNAWYFDRLNQLADLCDHKGLVLIHEHFFQHNILEAGAHWASSPWRSANNINNTGFPEPPNYAGDKRIFVADQFYDVTNTTRCDLYRAYIRKCLDNTVDNSNVIHMTSGEFTGPLAFTRFWLDTIAQWEKETGKKPLVAISACKDVQDAILADPQRAGIVDIIDIQYWWYQSDGNLYAPPGGKNLSPRQFQRLLKPKPSSAEQVERAVREYRQKYPQKAVTYSADGAERFADAIRKAGGSLAEARP
jgi:hypothetical protein